MNALDQISDLSELLKKLHANHEMNGADRGQIMIANDLLRNLTPFREHRAELLDQMLADDDI